MHLLLHAALVAAGSVVGGLARWSLGTLTGQLFGNAARPFATFFINVSGCLLLGWLGTVLAQRLRAHNADGVEALRLLIGVGFCGAYTTFSTFGVEADTMFSSGNSTAGYLYVASSVLCGLFAVRLGAYLAGGP